MRTVSWSLVFICTRMAVVGGLAGMRIIDARSRIYLLRARAFVCCAPVHLSIVRPCICLLRVRTIGISIVLLLSQFYWERICLSRQLNVPHLVGKEHLAVSL